MGFSVEEFRKEAEAVVNLISNYLQSSADGKAINWKSPEDQLAFWEKDFNNFSTTSATDLFRKVMEHSVNLHCPKYMRHQVAVTLPVTILSNALIACLNQGSAVYEMGMAGNAIAQVVTRDLARRFGFGEAGAGMFRACTPL